MAKLRFERDSAAAAHHELLISICCIVKAREKRNDRTPDTLAKRRKFYDEGRKPRSEVHVAELCDLRKQMATLTSDSWNRTLEVYEAPGWR